MRVNVIIQYILKKNLHYYLDNDLYIVASKLDSKFISKLLTCVCRRLLSSTSNLTFFPEKYKEGISSFKRRGEISNRNV